MGKLIEEALFRKEEGDQIEVRPGGPAGKPVEVSSCRLYFQARQVQSRGEWLDLGERRKTGYIAGRALEQNRGPLAFRWPTFYLTVRPGKKKRKRGEPELLVFDCRVNQRRRTVCMFTVLAEGSR